MGKIEFGWKSITEIPTEHWVRNYNISPLYLVKCAEKDAVHKVTAWSDIKI